MASQNGATQAHAHEHTTSIGDNLEWLLSHVHLLLGVVVSPAFILGCMAASAYEHLTPQMSVWVGFVLTHIFAVGGTNSLRAYLSEDEESERDTGKLPRSSNFTPSRPFLITVCLLLGYFLPVAISGFSIHVAGLAVTSLIATFAHYHRGFPIQLRSNALYAITQTLLLFSAGATLAHSGEGAEEAHLLPYLFGALGCTSLASAFCVLNWVYQPRLKLTRDQIQAAFVMVQFAHAVGTFSIAAVFAFRSVLRAALAVGWLALVFVAFRRWGAYFEPTRPDENHTRFVHLSLWTTGGLLFLMTIHLALT